MSFYLTTSIPHLDSSHVSFPALLKERYTTSMPQSSSTDGIHLVLPYSDCLVDISRPSEVDSPAAVCGTGLLTVATGVRGHLSSPSGAKGAEELVDSALLLTDPTDIQPGDTITVTQNGWPGSQTYTAQSVFQKTLIPHTATTVKRVRRLL
jgi:hypothetical protein